MLINKSWENRRKLNTCQGMAGREKLQPLRNWSNKTNMQKNGIRTRLSINELFLFVILTLALTHGITNMMGIPTIIPKSITEFMILLLFVESLCSKRTPKWKLGEIIGFLPMFCLFGVCLLSFAVTEQTVLSFLLFLQNVFIYYLLFVAMLNLNLSENGIKKLNKYLAFLFLIQLPMCVLKYIYYGITESGFIGTISATGGNFSTTLPLFAMAFLFSFYLLKKKKLYILLTLGFIVFGLIGSKRALAFYVPILLFFLYYIYATGTSGRRITPVNLAIQVRSIIAIALVSCLGVYAAGRILISLNPDSKIGGRFDPHFMMNTVVDYLTMETEEGYTFGRVNSSIESLRVLNDNGFLTVLLGFGPGLLTESSLTDTETVEVTTNLFGIYRGQTGFVWLVLQIGILGVFFFLLFYFQLFKEIFLLYRQTSDPYWKPIILGLLGATFVFVLDFSTYSQSTMFLGVLTPVYFYVAATCFKAKTFRSGP